ncbi:MAG: glycosyltransferase [Anaerolineaceae bacterium]|nr:glycosyltransferase [Anaerolineaceae bacterium]
MLNIAMISYHTCPLAVLGGKNTGGMNVYIHELTKQLGVSGVHVDVFTRSQDDHIPQVLHDLGYGNRVVHIPAGPEVPLSKEELTKHIPQFIDGIRAFQKKKQIKYDIIHSNYWMSGLAAIPLKIEWQTPLIHMFHTLGIMKNKIARGIDEFEGDYRINGEKEVIRASDWIIAATPAEKIQLETLYKEKIKNLAIISPGVDTSHFYPIPPDEAKAFLGVSPEERIFLFVGRIEPLKGIDTLLRAIGLIKTSGALECCPHRLAIIGGDPEISIEDQQSEMSRLQKLCKDIGIEDIVLFLGKQGQDTLPYYYSAAEVVVVPSHYESFGMVALEAMACATPVVASQVGGLAYLIKDGITGYFVPGNDPAALSDKLVKMIFNPELREKLGEQAAVYAHTYSWETITDQIVKLYFEALAEKRISHPL